MFFFNFALSDMLIYFYMTKSSLGESSLWELQVQSATKPYILNNDRLNRMQNLPYAVSLLGGDSYYYRFKSHISGEITALKW